MFTRERQIRPSLTHTPLCKEAMTVKNCIVCIKVWDIFDIFENTIFTNPKLIT